MSAELIPVVREFKGTALTTSSYTGQPAWVGREIGRAIGYSHGGKRLANETKGDSTNAVARIERQLAADGHSVRSEPSNAA